MCFLVNVYSLVLLPKESRGVARIGEMKNEAEHPVSTFLERRIKPQPALLSRRMTAGALAAGGAWDPQVSGVRAARGAGEGVLAAAFQSGSPHLAGHCPLEATESRLQLGEKGTWPRLEIRIDPVTIRRSSLERGLQCRKLTRTTGLEAAAKTRLCSLQGPAFPAREHRKGAVAATLPAPSSV